MTSATIKASSHTGGHRAGGGHHTPAVVVTRNCDFSLSTNLAHHPCRMKAHPPARTILVA